VGVAAFPTVRVAAIQATPVILDAEGCVEKAARLLHVAADRGAQLAVLPECFVPLYPSNAWGRAASGFGGWDEMWERLWANSVDVSGPLLLGLVDVCRERDLFCAIGVNERESNRPGTLYNTIVYLGPSGVIGRHRKLMPTQHERLFHGIGAGDDLAVVEAAGARVGGLICWENRMPLARYTVYRGGPQIWVAPTADDSDGWLASMRHIAIESGAYVVSVPQFIPAAAFPEDFPIELPAGKDVFGRGGAAVIEPTAGDVISGPLYDEEGILLADCDLRRGLHAKRWFDCVGHYGREDVFAHESAAGRESDQ
jgi:nitrilase